MGTCGLSDIYTFSPRACGPRASGVYIRQTTLAHVTTIQYDTSIFIHLALLISQSNKKVTETIQII